ncbi:serine hydrolase domain-containing protein [Spongiimicrobium salis]|uniref:serine hydrolase domain-containing protein n=1 Tax=Spongiimicrobium salis TaxID=1667022 RepID=UPI00374D309C
MKGIVVALFVLMAVSSFSQEAELRTIDAIIESKIKEKDPGLMVGIVKDGNVIYEKYAGLANLTHQVKITEKTRSNIASTAKQFTALMILQLSLEGKLDLEDDIRKYTPSLYSKVKEKIRVRHVINHTAGIRDYVALMDLKQNTWMNQVGLDNEDVMALLEQQEELAFKPGSKYHYSNSGYIVLAKIIEKVSGEKFTDYSKTFFKTLGMTETSFVEKYMRVIPNRAEPYADWGGGEWLESPTVTKTAGEGFLFTTLKDQLIYEQALQNADKNNNVLLIKSQLPIPNSEIKTYGYGLRLFNWFRQERESVHHDGGTYGYNSQTVRFTKEHLTVFVMSNNGNIRSDLVADEVAKVFLPPIEVKNENAYDPKLKEWTASATNPEILGQYISPGGTLTRIEKEQGKIYLKQNGNLSVEIIAEGKNSYALSYDPEQKIVFHHNEMIIFRPDGGSDVFKRSLEPAATPEDLEGFVGSYYSSELDMDFELKLDGNHQLKIKFSNRKNERQVEALHRNELLSRNFILKVQRDAFDRPINMLVSLGGALNNRFVKKTNLKFRPKIKIENGSIQVTTIPSKNGDISDILLTKNYENGNEIWSKRFGGSSYDKASSILETTDGYLIIGSTSSYGKGNYDMYVVKTDKKGHKIWQNTYGNFYNEYGYSAELTDKGYLIKGTIQNCENNTDINRKCTSNVWFVAIDENGKQLSSKILETL